MLHNIRPGNFFCTLGCSQAYHCLQMAGQRTVEKVAFLPAELLRIEDYQKTLADHCR